MIKSQLIKIESKPFWVHSFLMLKVAFLSLVFDFDLVLMENLYTFTWKPKYEDGVFTILDFRTSTKVLHLMMPKEQQG
jgi:hypothetical protein